MTLADPPTRLSVRLRTGTRSDHDAAQGSGFLDRLASGDLPRAAYADLATQHWFIYETLEQAAAAMAGDPVAGPFVFPELTRLPALTDDLSVLTGRGPHPDPHAAPLPAAPGALPSTHGALPSTHGALPSTHGALPSTHGALPSTHGALPSTPGALPSTPGALPATHAPLPATEEYRARLRAVAFDQPWGFIAHHYTRYLGDLSGGQYLGPAIAKAYGLDGAGHRFFVFDGVSPPAFRTRYREMLDQVPFSPADEERFLAEVSEAYRLNIAVLTELKERWA